MCGSQSCFSGASLPKKNVLCKIPVGMMLEFTDMKEKLEQKSGRTFREWQGGGHPELPQSPQGQLFGNLQFLKTKGGVLKPHS